MHQYCMDFFPSYCVLDFIVKVCLSTWQQASRVVRNRRKSPLSELIVAASPYIVLHRIMSLTTASK